MDESAFLQRWQTDDLHIVIHPLATQDMIWRAMAGVATGQPTKQQVVEDLKQCQELCEAWPEFAARSLHCTDVK